MPDNNTAPHDLLDVATFAARHPAWTPAALRALIFAARERLDARGSRLAPNGLAPAIYRVGRRVLLSEAAFFAWVAAQQQRSTGAEPDTRRTRRRARARA